MPFGYQLTIGGNVATQKRGTGVKREKGEEEEKR